jgi:hypothetical protein
MFPLSLARTAAVHPYPSALGHQPEHRTPESIGALHPRDKRVFSNVTTGLAKSTR